MGTLTAKDVEHVFESLRKGLVPERGIDTFAVGIEKQRGELHRQLELAGGGEGTIKFLRGGYGCGKTFMARLALLDAKERGFATSFVVVSDNDLKSWALPLAPVVPSATSLIAGLLGWKTP
jgi:chromosomal replication initiation ATPase DnaA